MSVFDDSFVILGDDASESAPVSAYDGSVHVDDSTDDVFAAPSSDYGNGDGVFGSSGGHDGPILPPPSEMESDEGTALREWRRQNAIQLEEKEKREKELRNQIIEEANQFKEEFHKKRELACENNKAANREKEKSLETESDPVAWGSIAKQNSETEAGASTWVTRDKGNSKTESDPASWGTQAKKNSQTGPASAPWGQPSPTASDKDTKEDDGNPWVSLKGTNSGEKDGNEASQWGIPTKKYPSASSCSQGGWSNGDGGGADGKRNRPPRTPGSENNFARMLTATGHRVDMFTSEEQELLSDVEPGMRRLRNIMHHSGYTDGEPISDDDKTYVLGQIFNFHPEKESKLGSGLDFITMSVFDDSFVILGDDASESAPVSAYDGSVHIDDVFAAPSSDYGNGDGVFGSNGGHDGPILPPPSEMDSDEGTALREWRRQNAIQLEEKEKREKELRNQIIEEANQFKEEFHKKRELACENNKAANREKEKRSCTRDDPKKPTISVIQGPKPGKPTDLSRMRQILLKLKQNPPTHLKLAPQPSSEAAAPPKNVPETKPTEPVAAA
ncbi:hypothetical protein F2Q68_00024057 [Brassica cretica]|uniref:Clathrin light chain n=1 Tax=Brassica cretica TaxID=69181 RepID=A0A8S9I837_BRACR|nr:hypothetical protein F2Q68_00024057 [Brassica cretica]